MDSNVGVHENFNNHVAKPSLFKTFTNFTLGEFEKLVQLVSTIINHARFIKEHHHVIGWLSNMHPK